MKIEIKPFNNRARFIPIISVSQFKKLSRAENPVQRFRERNNRRKILLPMNCV